jgi:hypothetical protein
MAWDWAKISVATNEMFVEKKVEDSVFSSNVLLDLLRKKGIKKKGGTQLSQPVNLGRNTNVGSYFGYDILENDPMQTLGKAILEWSQYYGAVSVSGRDQRINEGSPEAIFDLIDNELDIVKESLMECMTIDVFGDGSGNFGKDLDGLTEAIDDGTNFATYEAINGNVYLDWKANYYANGGIGRAVTVKLLGRARSATLSKGMKANVGITTVAILDKLSEMVQPYMVVGEGTDKPNLGFDNVTFQRTPVFADENCTANRFYWLQLRDIQMVVHPSCDFVFVPFAKPINQDAQVAYILWMGNLFCKRRNSHAQIRDLDANL